MTSKGVTPKELDSVCELLTKLERVVAVAVSEFDSDMERERAKLKRPTAKAVKALAATFEKAWFERCSGFGDLAKLLIDVAEAGSSCGRDMLAVRKLANGLKSAIANNHLAGALGSQSALARLAANTGDAVAEVEVLAEQMQKIGQKKDSHKKSPKKYSRHVTDVAWCAWDYFKAEKKHNPKFTYAAALDCVLGPSNKSNRSSLLKQMTRIKKEKLKRPRKGQ